jgi:hypothetical protein
MAPNKKNVKGNLKNEESELFKRLTRLFSGPITSYKQQAQLRYRRQQLNKFSFDSASGKQFQKTSYNPFNAIQSNMMANQSRAERYADFDQMEFTPEIASALDIYADEMTTHTSFSKILKIDSPNEEIKSILNTLYYDVLNIRFNLFGWCRTMVKFGDMFLYLDIDEETGVKNAMALPSQEIERLEGEDKTNPSYVQFQWNSGGLTFENWQIAHFRVLGQDKYAPYGTSALEPCRRIWRQLQLLEDAMMAYRIVRAPDRRVFYIDVGNIAPEDVPQFMLAAQAQMKRNMIVDQNTGRVDLRYNPMSIDEDYFIPVRGQSATKIDNLQGGQFQGDIDDVKYLRDKLFSALKIPASYLTKSEGGDEDKATLAQKDIRFARTVQRLQAVIVEELQKIGIIHLFTLGYRNQDLLNFTLSLNNPSKISELQELEHWKTKFDVASQAKEDFFSRRWISENIFKLSERDFKKLEREIYYDKILAKRLEMAGQEDAAAAAGGAAGGAGDMGMGDMGAGGADMGMGDMGAAPEAGAAPEESDGVTEPIMPGGAAPAKRRDDYKPVAVDRRDAKGRSHSLNKTAVPGALGFENRTVVAGADDLRQIAKLTEDEDTNYSDEAEKKIHEVGDGIRRLIESLEKKNAKQI